MHTTELSLQRYFPWLLALGILLNIPGLWLDVMEPDGALYATIAKHIVQHNDWINLYGNGQDWLDKPHFPFWMAAVSYKFLGLSGFAYKLPAFIFWLISLWYTYLTARDLFNHHVARVSVLIYTVALHSTLANFDVRAEPYLTACIVAAIWHMLCVYKRKHWIHMIAAALFSACAIMTKGIFVLITLGGGWLIFWIITKQWHQFLNYRWWIFLGLTFLFILPELYCLYQQFDLHPEKVVFGRTHVSGLRFFFWESQFGRFFNSGPIKGKGDITFFLHTTLWAFLPWSIGLIAAIVHLVRFDRASNPLRWIIYGSTIITFVLFSLSKFQLPHYIVIMFPYFSILTGYYLFEKAQQPILKRLVIFQSILMYILCGVIVWLLFFTKIEHAAVGAVITVMLTLSATFIRVQIPINQLLFKGYITSVMLYVFLFYFFYPFLLQYQSGTEAARLIGVRKDHSIPVASYQSFSYSFEFYSPGDVRLINDTQQLSHFIKKNPCYLYTTASVGDSLIKAGLDAEILTAPGNFHITKLKLGFLDHAQRDAKLETRYLLYINDKIGFK
jgi:4-amino-4-deoxy-L-arabinose transferase-like glycosyltransferase